MNTETSTAVTDLPAAITPQPAMAPPRKTTSEMKWYLVLFIIATLGGAVRKWGTSSGAVSNVVLGIQMVVPFLLYYFRSPNSYSPFQRFGILYVYYFYLLFHVIYPLQLTFYHGLFGLLIHGGFWLGIFYYLANRHLFNPGRYMNLFIIIAAVEVVLAFIQYQLPQTHFLNKYAREGQSIAVVVDRVRVTGTFSYLSGYTAFMIFYSLFMWALARMRFPQWLVMLAVTMGVVASFMTGSRSGLVIYIVLVVPMLVIEYPVASMFRIVGRLILPAMIITAVVLVYKKIPVFDQASKAYDNFMLRVETNRKSGEETGRLLTDVWYIQNANFKYPLTGVGLGSTYQGANILFGTSRYVREFGYAESEFTRVLLEGGWTIILLKVILGLLMALNLSFSGFMRWAVWFVAAFGQPIVFNPHNAAFLLLGIILVDNIIWRQKMEKERRRKEAEGLREKV